MFLLIFTEGPMLDIFRSKSIVRLMLAWTLIAVVPVCQAQSTANLDKHSRKIHRKLAKYPPGTYVRVVLRADPDKYGALGAISETTFTIRNAESNAMETHAYSEVARVEKGKEYIGAGSEPEHHVHWLMLGIIGVFAVGAVVTAVEVR
jgi:hypothetical protein